MVREAKNDNVRQVELQEGIMRSATVDIGTLIACTPDMRAGRPRITGTGVTVHRIVTWYKMGLSPEEITAEISHLTLAQVHAALAYYHANRDEIELAIAADEAEATRLEEAHDPDRGQR